MLGCAVTADMCMIGRIGLLLVMCGTVRRTDYYFSGVNVKIMVTHQYFMVGVYMVIIGVYDDQRT